jgi:hypothetical protein
MDWESMDGGMDQRIKEFWDKDELLGKVEIV